MFVSPYLSITSPPWTVCPCYNILQTWESWLGEGDCIQRPRGSSGSTRSPLDCPHHAPFHKAKSYLFTQKESVFKNYVLMWTIPQICPYVYPFKSVLNTKTVQKLHFFLLNYISYPYITFNPSFLNLNYQFTKYSICGWAEYTSAGCCFFEFDRIPNIRFFYMISGRIPLSGRIAFFVKNKSRQNLKSVRAWLLRKNTFFWSLKQEKFRN